MEFRIWKQGRVNLDGLNAKLKSAVSQGLWDLVSEYYLLHAPLCYDDKGSMKHIESSDYKSGSCSSFPTSLDTSGDSQTLKTYCMKYSVTKKLKELTPLLPKSVRKHRFEDVGTSTDISASCITYPAIEGALKANELKINVNCTVYEKGERGILHENYANVIVKWFECAAELGVPAVKKYNVTMKNRHSIGVCVRELQYVVTSLAPDTSVKAFDLQCHCKANYGLSNSEIYVPHNMGQMPMKTILIGRSFEQWKISISDDPSFNYTSFVETSLLKHYQKFTPSVLVAKNKFIPRQRLLLAIIVCNEVS